MPYKNKNVVVGYFAIANKTTEVSKNMFKGKSKKRFLRFATFRPEYERYCISLPLLGQLGKNFHNGYDKLISGDILLKLACDKIREVQSLGLFFVYLQLYLSHWHTALNIYIKYSTIIQSKYKKISENLNNLYKDDKMPL